jgi:hypothetical protein
MLNGDEDVTDEGDDLGVREGAPGAVTRMQGQADAVDDRI